MPNQASHAGHIPQRTCVICRQKTDQGKLLRFVLLKGKYVIDPQRVLSGRGYYCCEAKECVEKIEKWIQRYRKRKQKKA